MSTITKDGLLLALGAALRARAEAERANEAKDAFLAVLSHELRSPMTAVLGWLGILKTHGMRDPDLAARAIETIERNVMLQSQVINDLLDVSRVISGKLQLELTRVDLASAATQCVESLRPSAETKQVSLILRIAPKDVEVFADNARLQQVIANLVGNAIKFTDAGGQVTVTVDRSVAGAMIVVEDTGQGIPPELLPHVFERLCQGQGTTGRKQGGLGLGLAIVKSLVTLHGGRVRAESAGPGTGARFSMTLPLAAKRPRPNCGDVPTGPKRAASPVRRDVLLVEDDADSRLALELALAAGGARVRAVDSVRAALAAYATKRPDVLVSDVGMADQDGYALIRTIREQEARSAHRTLAIAVTGYAGRQDREMALEAGFDEHLPKPVEIDVLLEQVLRAPLAAGQRGAVRGRRA